MTETMKASPRITPAAGTGAALFTAGGLVAAFGVVSCCGLPFLLATAGMSTAWLSGFALLAAPYRSFLLVASAICLVAAAVLSWRQPWQAACPPGAARARSVVRTLTLIGLLLGVVLLYLGYTYA